MIKQVSKLFKLLTSEDLQVTMAESFPAIDTPESKNGSTIRSQRKSDFSAKTSVPRQKWSDEETSRLLRLRAENPHVAFEELEKVRYYLC